MADVLDWIEARVPEGSERSGGAGPGPLGQVEVVVLLHEGIGEPLPPPGEEGGVGEVGGDVVHRRLPHRQAVGGDPCCAGAKKASASE